MFSVRAVATVFCEQLSAVAVTVFNCLTRRYTSCVPVPLDRTKWKRSEKDDEHHEYANGACLGWVCSMVIMWIINAHAAARHWYVDSAPLAAAAAADCTPPMHILRRCAHRRLQCRVYLITITSPCDVARIRCGSTRHVYPSRAIIKLIYMLVLNFHAIDATSVALTMIAPRGILRAFSVPGKSTSTHVVSQFYAER